MQQLLRIPFLSVLCATWLILGLHSACLAGNLLDSIFPKQAQSQAPLHGNTESKVYHSADCEHYNCKSCTKVFTSAQQAKQAGYHPCSICGGKEGSMAKRQGGLHGNPTSMVVHGPSCQYYHAKNSTVVFSYLEEAKRQGYRICSICNGK